MFHKINLLFGFLLLSAGTLLAQPMAVKLSPQEETAYKTQCRQMMEYLEGTLNFLGNPENPPAEKEIIINESYLKIFQNDKVQIEGDLDEHRVVPLHKDVQAYLKDVVFFFKKVSFSFHITDIRALPKPNGNIYFKVTMNRTLKGITVEGDTVDNRQLRYVEINLDPEKNSLKIASIYTTKPSDDLEIQYWWNHLSPAWRSYFGKAIRVYDSIPLDKVLAFSDSTLVVEQKKVIPADSLPSGTTQNLTEDSLIRVNDSVVTYPDTLKLQNSRLMIQLVRHLRNAREVDITNNLDIENLAPLSEMDNLRSLRCAHTLIDNLTPLRTLSRLQVLDITGCPVESMEPLRYVSELREVDAAYTPLAKGGVVVNFKKLETLNLSHTRIDSLPDLKALSHLHTLELDATPLQTIDSLAGLHGLTALNLSKTPVSDFRPLSHLTSLQSLNLDSTRITDLHPLATLDSLTVLQINGTRVHDLSPLTGLKALKTIYCDNSGVDFKEATAFQKKNPHCQVIYNSQKLEQWWSTLPESWKNIFIAQGKLQQPVTKEQLHRILLIKKLDIHGNRAIHSLKPLEMLIQLNTLNIAGTAINDLQPLASVPSLRKLDISGTGVRSLEPLQKLKNLETINLENTAVADLSPLTGNHRLKRVLADGTKVKPRYVFALEKALPQCLVIYQTPQLKIWWNGLNKTWQQAFAGQLEMDDPPTAEQLQQLVNLEKINISGRMDMNSAEPLAVFTRLKTLRLDNTGITDISPLTGLKQLTSLSVTNSPLWDIGPLSGMKQLKELNLENTSVEDLRPLQGLHRLEKLNISGTKVRNLKPVAGLSALRQLVMNNTRVNSLKYVMPLPNLTLLRCDHTYLRAKKVEAFKRKHPKTKVIFY